MSQASLPKYRAKTKEKFRTNGYCSVGNETHWAIISNGQNKCIFLPVSYLAESSFPIRLIFTTYHLVNSQTVGQMFGQDRLDCFQTIRLTIGSRKKKDAHGSFIRITKIAYRLNKAPVEHQPGSLYIIRDSIP